VEFCSSRSFGNWQKIVDGLLNDHRSIPNPFDTPYGKLIDFQQISILKNQRSLVKTKRLSLTKNAS